LEREALKDKEGENDEVELPFHGLAKERSSHRTGFGCV